MRRIGSRNTIITSCNGGNSTNDESLEAEALVRILLTNDDGIYAPGLRALLLELRKIGEVVVVAPATEQSAVGHSVTILTPLLAQPLYDDDRRPLGWAVE